MIIFLYGENDFKIHQKTEELKNKFIKEVDQNGQNIWKLDGEKIKIEDLSSKLGSSSLFISKKMLIISNLIKNKQKDFLKIILDYIKKNKINESPDILIFTEKHLKSKNDKNLVKINDTRETALNNNEKLFFNFLLGEKYTQELKKFNNQELIDFIKREFKKFSLDIDSKLAQNIINLTGASPWMIKNEIKKISHLKLSDPNNKKIDTQDIEDNIFEKHQENIFAFTDSISSRNIKQSLDILEKQYLADLEADYILSMLIRQFKILLQIRNALELNFNTSKIISSLKLHPFIINKGINQARNFDKETLKNIINQLIELDKKNRSEFCDLKSEINLIINKL